jgi:hypothetical protein
MNWEKQGKIFETPALHDWDRSHAQVPVIDVLNDKVWRIYYATRNAQNQCNTSFIEVEAGNPANVLYRHDRPIFELGAIGTFDDAGIMPSCILDVEGKKYMYYIGWNAGTTVGYRLAIGLAISDDGITFRKYSTGPVMDRSIVDNCLCASPFVIREDDGWKMWYVSGTHWELINGKPEPFYHIKYASSADGINWDREGIVCIDYDDFTEGISRPCVLKTEEGYIIFYSFRNNTDYRNNSKNAYRIGYATSRDGIAWERKDEQIGIAAADTGWDSEMVAYPYVVPFGGRYYMLYNGNGFGKSGFGYAVANSIL